MGRRRRKTYTELEQGIQQPIYTGELQEWPAAIYARLSVENSGKDDKGESIEGQTELCRDYIEEHPDLHLYDTYIDNGWTGTNTDRPAFQRLLGDIEKGKVKALVIKDFSRFSRDYIEAGNLLENVFPCLGVRFISVADRYDSFETDGSSESLLIPLKNLINSYYSIDISRKVATAIQARQQAAAYIPSMIPYGYIKSRTQEYRFEPDPETRDVVARIFQMRIDGVPLNRIAGTLQAEGIPSPGKLRYLRGTTTDKRYANSRWSAQLVKQILRNPTYLGNLVFGRMPTALYLGKPKYQSEFDESKWRILEGMHEPLVTREVFDKAGAMAERGRKAWEERLAKGAERRAADIPLFRGILFCGDCGSQMRYSRCYHDGKIHGSYYCGAYDYGRCAGRHTISQEKLKKIVWQSMQDQMLLYCEYRKIPELLQNKGGSGQLEECRKEIQSLSLQISSRRAKRERLYEDFTDGILSPEEYMAVKKKYDDEYQELSAKANEVQARMIRLKKSFSSGNPWLKSMGMLEGKTEVTMELVTALIDRLTIYQDGDGGLRLEIEYKCREDVALLESAREELEGGTD